MSAATEGAIDRALLTAFVVATPSYAQDANVSSAEDKAQALAGALVVAAVLQYFFYRFRVEADGLVIRSGVLQKSLRHIPFHRVHNVALHQSLLHRLAGVAEVRLESAGGMKPEAEMRVLSLADAHALEELVRAHGHGAAPAATGETAAAAPESRELLALDTLA